MTEVEVDTDHAGYEVYANNCMSCHGDSLQGVPGMAPELIGLPYDAEAIKDIAQMVSEKCLQTCLAALMKN